MSLISLITSRTCEGTRMSRICSSLTFSQRIFLQSVEKKFPDDRERLARMSLIEEGFPKQIRMAYLAIIGTLFLFPLASRLRADFP